MQAAEDDDTKTAAATTACQLPRDVLGSILLRLRPRDLRRSRRVCKEWRDVASDPGFVDAHKLHGPQAPVPTHTIVFFDGRSRSYLNKQLCDGGGFLFDEQWKLAARFSTDKSLNLLGTCNDLLFFRDFPHGAINVVDPFTGASIGVVPLPPNDDDSYTYRDNSYGLGFDPTARQYKLVYPGKEQAGLLVFTVGADTEWRTLRFSCDLHGVLRTSEPACGDGAVYWESTTPDGIDKYARLDLATEEITSVDRCRRLADGRSEDRTPWKPITCTYPSGWDLCRISVSFFGEWEDGCWPHNVTALPHKVDATWLRRRQDWHGYLPPPHALQRGRLLLQDWTGRLEAHRITSATEHNELCIGGRDELMRSNEPEVMPVEKYRFVPKAQEPAASDTVARIPGDWYVYTFAYTPTRDVSSSL